MNLYPQHPTSQTALKPSEIISEALSSGELKPEDVNVKLSDVEVDVDVGDQLDRHSTTSTASSSSTTGDDDGNLNKDEKGDGADDDGDDRSESEFVNENLDYTGPEMVSDFTYCYTTIYIDMLTINIHTYVHTTYILPTIDKHSIDQQPRSSRRSSI